MPQIARPQPAVTQDVVAELAAMLPPDADRCAVARTGLLPARRRAFFLRLSQGDPTAWLPGAPFTAFATAERIAGDGRRSFVMFARIAAEPETVRAFLDAHVSSPLLWGSEPSGGRGRSQWAQFLGRGVLRVQRGRWPEATGPAGVSTRCLELVRMYPDAIEVASRRGEEVILGEDAQFPRRVDTLVRVDGRAVTIRRDLVFATARQAIESLRSPDSLSGGPGLLGDTLADAPDTWRRGRVVAARSELLWSDLELLAEDDRQLLLAAQAANAVRVPRPASDVDVSNLAVVRQQRRLWRDVLAASHGAARRGAAEQLRLLLSRAIALHAAEHLLAEDLARVLLDELDDPAQAVAVVDGVLTQGPPEPEEWQMLRREALARFDQSGLARALEVDGILNRNEVPSAASDLVSLVGAGVDYAFAEGVRVAVATLVPVGTASRLRAVPPARLPLESLPDAVVELATLGRELTAPSAVYVVARDVASATPVPWHPDTAPVVRLRDRRGEPVLVGVATLGDPRLGRIGVTLTESLASGPVELIVFLVPMDGSGPDVVVRVAGRLDNGAFDLERAAAGAARVDWPAVARYLGAPLGALERRLFPPPELVVDAEGTDDARLLAELAVEVEGVRCETVALRVRCFASAERPDAALRLLRRFAGRRLAAEAARLR